MRRCLTRKENSHEDFGLVCVLQKVMKSMANGSAFGDVRRSARTRKVPGQKDVHLTVSSSLTLRELKQMVCLESQTLLLIHFTTYLIVSYTMLITRRHLACHPTHISLHIHDSSNLIYIKLK